MPIRKMGLKTTKSNLSKMVILEGVNSFIVTEDELKMLLEKSFYSGALSYAQWDGQHDTCWSNVEIDKKENSEAVINDLKKSNGQII